MLCNWTEFLSPDGIEEIHRTSTRVLAHVGVRFPNDGAIAVFKEHEVKIEDWIAAGRPDEVDRAYQRWQQLLAGHEDPPMDGATARQLHTFVEEHL